MKGLLVVMMAVGLLTAIVTLVATFSAPEFKHPSPGHPGYYRPALPV